MPDITTSDLDFSGEEGRSTVQRIDQLETELQRRGKNGLDFILSTVQMSFYLCPFKFLYHNEM